MAMYAGLTDDSDRRKTEHGNPPDFKVVKTFTQEKDARKWEKEMLDKGYQGGTGGGGWKYGYTYTITRSTKQ
jgi:hypothetical protein